MDSLLANYGSSDEEGGGGREEEENPNSPHPSKPLSGLIPPPRSTSSSSLFPSRPPPKSASSSLFSSLPPPKISSSSAASATTSSSSFFSSLPPPKPSSSSSVLSSVPPRKSTALSSSSSFFSSLPQPKSQQPTPPPPSEPDAKRVVQFRPPINPALFKPDDSDEDDDEEKDKRRNRTQDFSSKPLSALIPPPKHTLGLAQLGSSASARRSMVEADAPVKASNESTRPEWVDGGGFADQGSYGGQSVGGYAEIGVTGQPESGAVGGDVASSWAHGNYGSHEGYENYGSYGGDLDYGTSAAGTVSATQMGEPVRTVGKRGRDAIPSEILEVKQDELVKNRPREDQVRMTGIAFGPAYQPASSGKGKPSKLHKRKHQIGSLYFDMRQKEMELAERRAKGFLTKKETQAKYGW